MQIAGSFKRALSALGSSWGQFASGVGAMTTLAWLLWPDSPWKFEPEPAVAFVVSVVAWIGSFLVQRPKSAQPDKEVPASQHDLDLLRRLRDKLPEATRLFLRDHDFGGSFRSANVGEVPHMADTWRGSQFEFDDATLAPDFEVLLTSVRAFSNLIAIRTSPLNGGDFSTAVPDRERAEDWFSDQTRARIDELNEAATTVVEQLDAFLKKARQTIEK